MKRRNYINHSLFSFINIWNIIYLAHHLKPISLEDHPKLYIGYLKMESLDNHANNLFDLQDEGRNQTVDFVFRRSIYLDASSMAFFHQYKSNSNLYLEFW